MSEEPCADSQGVEVSASNTTSRFVASNGQVAADSKSVRLSAAGSVVDQNHVPMLGNVHFQAEVTGNEARAVVERHSMGAEPRGLGDRHAVDGRVLIERQPLGAGLLGDRVQRTVDSSMDGRLVGRRHQIDKERYAIEASGVGERFHPVNDRQYVENRSIAEGMMAEQRYHADSRIMRERCPVDSRSMSIESRPGRDRYPVMRERHIEPRSAEDGARAMMEGELQHMGDMYHMEVAPAADICSIDPRYPVAMRHSIEARSLGERHPIDTRNTGERYPMENRMLVERYPVDPRAPGERYIIETTPGGERIVWTEEANNIR